MKLLLLGLAAAAVLQPAAAGATRCVNAGGTGPCFATVQDAVDRAGPGEVVLVEPGYYRGPVVIVTSGLRLVGGGARPSDVVITPDDPGLDGVVLAAPGASVRNLMIVNAYHGVHLAAPGGSVLGVRISGVEEAGVFVDVGADGALVRGAVVASVFASQGAGLAAFANDVRLLRSVVRGTNGYGAYVEGDGFVARGNRFHLGWYTGVEVHGAGAAVRGNSVRNFDDDLIYVEGAGALVAANRADASDDHGVHAVGAGVTVTGNVVGGSEGSVILVEAAGGRVVGNAAHDGIHSSGFELRHAPSPVPPAPAPQMLLVRDNVARRAPGHCYYATGGGIVLDGNLAQACGYPGDAALFFPGFMLDGCPGCVVRGNVAAGCAFPGFHVYASDGAILRGNTARANGAGFGVEGSEGVLLVGNRATLSAWEGILIAPSASGTSLRNNFFTGNFCDFLDLGTGTAAPTAGPDRNVYRTVCDF